ncbi:MAG: protein kinase, partial [Thermoanaerobaculia bacterium]|nr:protein kinase [Thermoanaerobaculia bacterium]
MVSPLGAGGMGEVYRAVDRDLDREVALKVLSESLVAAQSFRVADGEVEFEARDEEGRLARLEGEARLLASLNHPNIATLFGLERHEELVFLAMELVPGETLDERIRRRPLSVDEAIPIFLQVADGLEAAHDRGVTHRDLKPANLMISDEELTLGGSPATDRAAVSGRVKILDFGLARSLGSAEEDDGESSVSADEDVTLTYASEERSRLRGTLGYLSPEQARGKAIDKRADIWAFGCCLFESLTGRRAFRGETVNDTLSEILKGEPPWEKIPASAPPALLRLLRRCLAKDRNRRLRDIGDARLELEEARAQLAGETEAGPTGRRWGSTLVALMVLLALVLGAAVGRFVTAPLDTAPEPARVTRLQVDLPAQVPISFEGRAPIALSPDGRTLVYASAADGVSRLYRRSLDRREVEAIVGTEGGRDPFFSPDGQSLGFLADNAIRRVPTAGGQAATVYEGGGLLTAIWGPDATVVFSVVGQGLQRVAAAGGSTAPVTAATGQLAGLEQHLPAEFLPDGETVLFTTLSPPANTAVEAVRIDGGGRVPLLQSAAAPRYLASGHLVFTRQGDLWAVPFDPVTLTRRGAETRVLEGVLHTGEAHPQYAVTATGTLAYVPGPMLRLDRRLAWIAADGSEEVLAAEPADWGFPRVSPDGRRVALSAFDVDSQDVWIYDFARESRTRFTFEDGVDVAPVWTRDGRRIAYGCSGGVGLLPRLCMKAADGTGDVELLTERGDLQLPGAFTPGDTALVFTTLGKTSSWDVWLLDLESGETAPLLARPYSESAVALSPDGRWLAYESDESGREEVYVRPFPDVGSGRWQVSTQ